MSKEGEREREREEEEEGGYGIMFLLTTTNIQFSIVNKHMTAYSSVSLGS